MTCRLQYILHTVHTQAVISSTHRPHVPCIHLCIHLLYASIRSSIHPPPPSHADPAPSTQQIQVRSGQVIGMKRVHGKYILCPRTMSWAHHRIIASSHHGSIVHLTSQHTCIQTHSDPFQIFGGCSWAGKFVHALYCTVRLRNTTYLLFHLISHTNAAYTTVAELGAYQSVLWQRNTYPYIHPHIHSHATTPQSRRLAQATAIVYRISKIYWLCD
jgi:hypothetical protein